MKPIRMFVYFTIVLVTLGGCIRLDNIENLNKPPEIVFNELDGILSLNDSIKISLKNSQKTYDILLQLKDPNLNIATLSYELLSGRGNLYQNGSQMDGNSINIDSDNSALFLSYEPSQYGLHTLEFNLIDDFDRSGIFTLELTAFDNLNPIANFKVLKSDTPTDPLERLIDAFESYDPDQKFGGGIVAYEFSVLGKTIFVQKSSILIIFPMTDDYDISLRVLDNDGQWSETEKKRVLVD